MSEVVTAQSPNEDPWTTDELAGLVQDVLDGQAEIKAQNEEILEKLTNLGLDRY